MDPGARLKEVRSKLGITTREFSAFSKIIADAEGNEEFLISSGWLTQIENEEDALPSIYKLFTLASVYADFAASRSTNGSTSSASACWPSSF